MALVFSCVAGMLGVAVIAWYGVGEIGQQQQPPHKKRVVDVAIAVAAEGKGEGEGKVEGEGKLQPSRLYDGIGGM